MPQLPPKSVNVRPDIALIGPVAHWAKSLETVESWGLNNEHLRTLISKILLTIKEVADAQRLDRYREQTYLNM